jgi:putative ABC transport system permease protein
MNHLTIAWRNIRRNTRRSALTLVAIATGTTAILLFTGHVNDTVNALQTVTVRSTGHLQVVAHDYLNFGRGNPGRFSIHDYPRLIATLQADAVLKPLVTVITPTLDVDGVAGNFAANTSTGFVGEGVVPADRDKLLAWDSFDTGIKPSLSHLDAAVPDGAVVGMGLAQLLEICPQLRTKDCLQRDAGKGPITVKAAPVKNDSVKDGSARDDSGKAADIKDASQELPAALQRLAAQAPAASPETGPVQIDLLTASPTGLPNAIRVRVLQADRQAVRQIDNMYVSLPLNLAQRLVFGPDERAASAIVIQLRHTADLERARARIETLAAGFSQPLDVLTFHQVNPIYDQIMQNYNMIFGFIATLISIITTFSIIGCINMAVSERTAEIGTLRALGFSRTTIRSIFIVEGALLGLIGAAIGAVAAIVLGDVIIDQIGLSWTPPGRTMPVPIRVDVFSDHSLIWGALLCVTVLSCLSALWPAGTAAKLEVTEALRHA